MPDSKRPKRFPWYDPTTAGQKGIVFQPGLLQELRKEFLPGTPESCQHKLEYLLTVA
jgi:hypothetical protein